MSLLKRFFEKAFIIFFGPTALQKIRNKRTLKSWELNGKPNPPPQAYKHSVIKEYVQLHDTGTFIETGTFYGDSLAMCRGLFKRLYSIELSDKLYELAKIRFAKDKKITILQGDSGEVIGELLKSISEKCLFWLDGHYSDGITAKGSLNTPILAELTHIFNHKIKGHVILIDDARCFTGEDDYPTIGYLQDFVKQHDPQLKFLVEHDIIRICH